MIFISLYAVVDFLPPFDSVDAMGAQWLYLVMVSVLTTVFILWAKSQNYLAGINLVIKNIMSLLYLALFFLATISIFNAINKTEAFVVYARYTATIIMYFNIAILLYNRPDLMKFLAHILALMLFFRSIQILISFAQGFGEIPLENLIYGQSRETGNKNIMAATFTVRLPFVLYCIYTSKAFGKIFYGAILTMGILVVFFLNARSTFVAVLLQTFLYLLFCGWQFLREHDDFMQKLKRISIRAAFLIVPLLIAFVIGQASLKSAVEMENREVAYGTVTSRLASISISGETSNNRYNFWRYAIDYAAHHPLMGCGIGNWKLASIPYERDISYELWVAYHCHNDFFEISAEVGIMGGLLLLGMYFCALVFTIRTWQSKAEHNVRLLSVMSLLALAGYFADAFFNFPNERPVMQFYFMIILAINVGTYLYSRKDKTENPTAGVTTKKLLYGTITSLLLILAGYVTYETYTSMVIQGRVNPDISIEVPKYNSDEAKKLPSIPNLNVFAYPIDAIKARYLLNEKKTDEALMYLNKSIHVNPYLSYNEFMKGAIFVETNKWDSAFVYSKKAFEMKPGARSNYLMFNYVAMKKGDTSLVTYAMVEHNKRKPSALVWDNYLRTMLSLPHDSKHLLAVADSALKLYPDDPTLVQDRQMVINTGGQTQAPVNNNIPVTQANDAAKYSTAGIEAFKRKDFQSAITNFQKAYQLNDMDYSSLENLGMSYYSIQNWNKSIVYYDKVIASKALQTGKSEFFKGICLVNLGKKDDGCAMMKIALDKHYPDAAKFIGIYCKNGTTQPAKK